MKMENLKMITRVASRITQRSWLTEAKYIGRLTRPMSTVSAKEIKHFESLSQQWWELEILHSFNLIRVPLVRDGLANTGFKSKKPSLPLQDIKIVDVGCGGGVFTEGLARIGADVTGIDMSQELINVAKEHAKLDSDISERVNYILIDVEEFSKKNEEAYDAVVVSEVIEHVENSELFLKECIKIIKPGGSIFITTPNKTLASWLGLIIMAEYILKIIPRGTHDWNKFIPPHDVQRVLDKYGCRTKLLHGYYYNPLTRRCVWSSNTGFGYAIHAIKQKNIDK